MAWIDDRGESDMHRVSLIMGVLIASLLSSLAANEGGSPGASSKPAVVPQTIQGTWVIEYDATYESAKKGPRWTPENERGGVEEIRRNLGTHQMEFGTDSITMRMRNQEQTMKVTAIGNTAKEFVLTLTVGSGERLQTHSMTVASLANDLITSRVGDPTWDYLVWKRRPADWKQATGGTPTGATGQEKPCEISATMDQTGFDAFCSTHSNAQRLTINSAKKITSLTPLEKMANLRELTLIQMMTVFDGNGEGRLDLGPVAKLPELSRLECWNTRVSNTDALKGLKKLRDLSFKTGCAVESIACVRDIPSLESLDLSGNDSTFPNYEPLSGSRLKTLDISHNPQATDANLKAIGKIQTLETLTLRHAPISDLAPLAGMTRLKILRLDGTQVSDLTPLANAVDLAEVYLGDTKVADISPLFGLKNLQTVSLPASVPVAQVEKLKATVTGIKIFQNKPAAPAPAATEGAKVLAADKALTEPGPMGQVVIAMFKAANTGDYVTAKSCLTTDCNVRGFLKTPEREKSYWAFKTKDGTLIFGPDKTRIFREKEEGDRGSVQISLWDSKQGRGISATYMMKKVDGKWMIDGAQ